ncbi:MAG: hypothetical protein HY270_23780 [Deltaproteobacteria bacterium]|nr:hypothetical protein [Deltaproteobacteria bacterium]
MRIRLLVAFLCVVAAPAFGRWEGPDNNRSLSQLESMDVKELFNEGFDVCVRRAVVASGLAENATSPIESAALDYLSVIEGVVRDKNGGKMPEWMRALSFAHTTKECQNVFRGFASGELRETKQAHTEAKPTPSPEAKMPQPTPDSWSTPTAPPPPHPHHKHRPTKSRTKTKSKSKTSSPSQVKASPTVSTTKPAAAPAPRPKNDVVDELPPWFRSR